MSIYLLIKKCKLFTNLGIVMMHKCKTDVSVTINSVINKIHWSEGQANSWQHIILEL